MVASVPNRTQRPDLAKAPAPCSVQLGTFHGGIDVDADTKFVHQLSTEKADHTQQRGGHQRQVQAPRHDGRRRIINAQQPVQGRQRKHHHRQNTVTPTGDQPTDTVHGNHVDQAYQPGQRAHHHADSSQPDAGTSPEQVFGKHEGQIGGYQANQGGDREVDDRGMQWMTANGHQTTYRLKWHESSCLKEGVAPKRNARCTDHRLAGYGALATLPGLSACSGPYSTLDPAGPSAAAALGLWWLMLGYFGVVMLVVIALWLKAMRRDASELDDAETGRQSRRWIIYGGLVLPSLSLTVLLAIGIPVGHGMLALPTDDALRIDVTAQQWWWQVQYPDHGIELRNELHIPAGTPIDVHLTSVDVIHSFWVPRLAGKLDMLPGRSNVLRLQADRPGRYQGQCAEFCGTGHAHMRFVVIAHSAEDYDAWLAEARSNDD